MNDNRLQLANEATQIEHHVGELYMIFHCAFPEDAEFWWKLGLEEKNHAALLKCGVEDYMPKGLFPMEVIGHSLQDMQEILYRLIRLFLSQSYHSAFTPGIQILGVVFDGQFHKL